MLNDNEMLSTCLILTSNVYDMINILDDDKVQLNAARKLILTL